MYKWLFPLSLLFVCLPVQAIGLLVTDWHYAESDFQTVNVAGDYYASSFESHASAAAISISAAPGVPVATNNECGGVDPAWKVSVWLSTVVNDLSIQVKREDNGSGGSVVGGEGYITLSSAAQSFFCGSGDISNIGLTFQINGLEAIDGNGTDTWKIRYRVDTL